MPAPAWTCRPTAATKTQRDGAILTAVLAITTTEALLVPPGLASSDAGPSGPERKEDTVMLDGWDDGLVDDSPPWVGRAALAVGAASVAAGVLGMAALVVAGTWLKRHLALRR